MSGTPCTHCGLTPSSDTADSSWNILEVLRSGHLPPSAASSCIPDRVAALETRENLISEDITRLKALLRQKRKEMAATKIEILQTESLAAPIRSIPPEILLRIFRLVRDAAEPPHRLTSLFKIGHVCKLWRKFSRTSPSLWSNIDIVEVDYKMCTNGIEEQLVLASPRPLDIHISLQSEDFYKCPNASQMLGVLSGHMSRCRSLHMTVMEESMWAFMEVLSRAHLGALESLVVTYDDQSSRLGPADLETLNLFLHPPLHSLHIHQPLDAFKAVKIHWPTLTSFAGPFLNSRAFLQFLTSARQLVDLHIMCIGADKVADGALHQSVVHENLRRLTLDLICGLSPALEKVSLPHLDALYAHKSHKGHFKCIMFPHVDSLLLSGLVERSQCKLKTFSLHSFHLPFYNPQHEIPPENLTSILRLSSITSFRVLLSMDSGDSRITNETEKFFDFLTVTDSQTFLPCLRELEISFDWTTDCLFMNERLPTMIQSRWDVPNDVARLTKLTLLMGYLSSPRPVCSTSQLALLLLDLQDKGLKASWTLEYEDVWEDVLKEAREYRQRFL